MIKFINVLVTVVLLTVGHAAVVQGQTMPLLALGNEKQDGIGLLRFTKADLAIACGDHTSISDKIKSWTSYVLPGINNAFTPKEYFEVLDWLTSKYDETLPNDYVYDDFLQIPLGFPEDM